MPQVDIAVPMHLRGQKTKPGAVPGKISNDEITHYFHRGTHCTGKTGKMDPKIPCQGKHREFGNFAKTQGKDREFGLLKL